MLSNNQHDRRQQEQWGMSQRARICGFIGFISFAAGGALMVAGFAAGIPALRIIAFILIPFGFVLFAATAFFSRPRYNAVILRNGQPIVIVPPQGSVENPSMIGIGPAYQTASTTVYPPGGGASVVNVSPYPGNMPYPQGNMPYPQGNMPYPQGNMPYPQGNILHASETTAYPPPSYQYQQNAQYPAQMPPPAYSTIPK